MIKLSRREKLLLLILAGTLAVVGIATFVVKPFLEYEGSIGKNIDRNINDLQRLEKLHEEYRRLKNEKLRYNTLLKTRSENITSMIEKWSQSSGVARNIAYARRSQSNIRNKYTRVTTDIKLEGVPAQNLMRFLYEIENSELLLNISYLRIHQGLKGSAAYDVIIKINSYTVQ